MTVPEMGKLLGLKKTDRYWLVHKNVFESKEIAGKIRINIASFEKWYANQIKYHKVTGEEPGKELKSWSYSVKEVADMLGVDEYLVYDLLKKNQMEAVIVDYWKRIPKESFQNWYKLSLIHIYWKSNYELVKEMMSQYEVYVFEADKMIQGFVGLNDEYIEGIFVSDEMQSCSIGKLLLDYVTKNPNHASVPYLNKYFSAIAYFPLY